MEWLPQKGMHSPSRNLAPLAPENSVPPDSNPPPPPSLLSFWNLALKAIFHSAPGECILWITSFFYFAGVNKHRYLVCKICASHMTRNLTSSIVILAAAEISISYLFVNLDINSEKVFTWELLRLQLMSLKFLNYGYYFLEFHHKTEIFKVQKKEESTQKCIIEYH